MQRIEIKLARHGGESEVWLVDDFGRTKLTCIEAVTCIATARDRTEFVIKPHPELTDLKWTGGLHDAA